MTLGERIYNLRTEKEMSQGDLADALEVSRQSISKWETNGSVPELDKLIKLSEIFDVSLDELITGKEKVEQPTAPPQAEQPVAPKVEPQVIYIEKPVKPSITPAQILGIVLLAGAVLAMVLFACFGKRWDLAEIFMLCLPVALWGVICLVTKRPLLWCGWCGSAVWWIYVFILSAKWEDAALLLVIGIALVITSLGYTIYLHKKERIHIPAWGWAVLTLVLAAAALLLMINLLPPATGTVTRPSEVIVYPESKP